MFPPSLVGDKGTLEAQQGLGWGQILPNARYTHAPHPNLPPHAREGACEGMSGLR